MILGYNIIHWLLNSQIKGLTMKISVKLISVLFVTVFLLNCGGGSSSDELPPKPTVIPLGTISVTARLGAIQNADVIIYDYSNGTKNDVISQATGVTDINGQYTIDIQSESVPILVCVNNGVYIEDASDVNNKIEVSFNPDDSLCVLAQYESGTAVNLNITFFTHVAYGLTIYNLNNGEKINDAITSAVKIISSWLDISATVLLNKIPKQISNNNSIPTDLNTPLSSEHKYGFANAAVSQLMVWIAKRNNIPVYKSVTSIAFSQIAFTDISEDGLFDGKAGVNQLTIIEAITEDLYRHKLALNLLIMAFSAENNSNLTIDDVFNYADGINNFSMLSLTKNTKTLTLDKPVITMLSPSSNDVIFGNGLINLATNAPIDPLSNALISATVVDVAGVQTATVIITSLDNSYSKVFNVDDYNPIKIPFDSTGIQDGNYKITITVSNVLGYTSSSSTTISIENNRISIDIKSPKNGLSYGGSLINVLADVIEPAAAPLESITLNLDGKPITYEPTVDLTSSLNSIKATIDSTAISLSDGSHTLSLIARSTVLDRALGSSKIVFYIDNTKPKISSPIISPLQVKAEPIFSKPEQISFQYTIEDPLVPLTSGFSSGLSYAEFLISGVRIGARMTDLTSSIVQTINPLSVTNGIRDYNDGWHLVTLNVTDKVGNQAQQVTKIGIDTKPPVITLNSASAQSNSWVKYLYIDGIANDDPGTGILKTEIFIGLPNTAPIFEFLNPASNLNLSQSFTHTFSTGTPNSNTNFSDGIYLISVKSTDKSNASTVTTISNIGVDTIPPLINAMSISTDPAQNFYVASTLPDNTAKCEVSINSSDPGYTTNTGSGLSSQEIYLGNNQGVISNVPIANVQFTTPELQVINSKITITGIPFKTSSFITKRKILIKIYDKTSLNIDTSLTGVNEKITKGCINIDIAVQPNYTYCPAVVGGNCVPTIDGYLYTPTCTFDKGDFIYANCAP